MSSLDETRKVASDKKTSWPELVGKSVEEAKKIILKDRPDVETIEVFPAGEGVSEDLRLNRVRLFVNTFVGTVAQIPEIG